MAAADQERSVDRTQQQDAKQPLPVEDDRSEAALAGESKALRQEIEAMRRDLRDVRAALKRIEERIGRDQGPSEFSPVTIRMQSEEGRPLPGFLVEMESARKEVRRVSASGRSDREGLALSRHLPYGDYRLRISEESGWSTTLRNVTVEVGTALEKVVVAPDPQERARLEVRSALRSEAFEGLRFGKRWQRTSSRGYGSPLSPEPGEEDDQFASFPTVDDGVSQVAVEVRIGIERAIEQPDSEVRTWRWSGSEDHPLRLLALEKSFATISDAKEDSTRPEDGRRYFVAGDGLSDDDYSVRFSKLALRQEADEQDFSLEIAPGDVTLSVREFLGRPEPDVLRSLGLEEDSGIWLEATLHGSSASVPRILDLEGWERGTGSTLAKQTLAAYKCRKLQLYLLDLRVSCGDSYCATMFA